LPIKGVSELFSKCSADDFIIEVKDALAVMKAGKNRYRFATYKPSDFPRLPTSQGATPFFSIQSKELSAAIERGGLCSSVRDDFPLYRSCVFFNLTPSALDIVSTNGSRLALGRADVKRDAEEGSFLLPLFGIRDLLKVIGIAKEDFNITVSRDDSQAYFVSEDMEYCVRMVSVKFPGYEGVLPQSFSTSLDIEKSKIMSSIERVDIVVRDYNRTVTLSLSEPDECALFAQSPEFGEAEEKIKCTWSGSPMKIGLNSRFFFDAIKACDSDTVNISLAVERGNIIVRPQNSDQFICLIAPVGLDGEAKSPSSSEDAASDAKGAS
jgi:DNA polymerase-3 subunit beta